MFHSIFLLYKAAEKIIAIFFLCFFNPVDLNLQTPSGIQFEKAYNLIQF